MKLRIFISLFGAASAAAFGIRYALTAPRDARRGLVSGGIAAAGFLLALAGDWFLTARDFGDPLSMLPGIGCFFLAHAAFLAFGCRHGSINGWVAGAAFIFYFLYFYFLLKLSWHEKVLLSAVFLYLVISMLSLGAAAGLRANRAARIAWLAGIALLLVSDTVISWKEFLDFHRFDRLILPTYAASQFLLGLALLLMMLRRPPEKPRRKIAPKLQQHRNDRQRQNQHQQHGQEIGGVGGVEQRQRQDETGRPPPPLPPQIPAEDDDGQVEEGRKNQPETGSQRQ